jgi:hypothetical protein
VTRGGAAKEAARKFLPIRAVVIKVGRKRPVRTQDDLRKPVPTIAQLVTLDHRKLVAGRGAAEDSKKTPGIGAEAEPVHRK